jgi:hypothetical protein
MNTVTPEIVSLLCGIAPLIGVFFLQIIITILYSLLVCAAEKVLKDENTPAPELSRKEKLHIVINYAFSKIYLSLSLKEHSPPLFPVTHC